jgi:hypothetical protein
MKYVSKIGRLFVAFVLASFVVNLFYGELFIFTNDNLLIFLIWGYPCLHLLVTTMSLLFIITGKKYRRYGNFSLFRMKLITELDFFSKRIAIKRFFFLINFDGKERIVSGSFVRMPSFLLVYKNPFDRLKTISVVDLFVKILWIFANLCVLAIIKLFMYRYLGNTPN